MLLPGIYLRWNLIHSLFSTLWFGEVLATVVKGLTDRFRPLFTLDFSRQFTTRATKVKVTWTPAWRIRVKLKIWLCGPQPFMSVEESVRLPLISLLSFSTNQYQSTPQQVDIPAERWRKKHQSFPAFFTERASIWKLLQRCYRYSEQFNYCSVHQE